MNVTLERASAKFLQQKSIKFKSVIIHKVYACLVFLFYDKLLLSFNCFNLHDPVVRYHDSLPILDIFLCQSFFFAMSNTIWHGAGGFTHEI